jgi:hypothetical protein
MCQWIRLRLSQVRWSISRSAALAVRRRYLAAPGGEILAFELIIDPQLIMYPRFGIAKYMDR